MKQPPGGWVRVAFRTKQLERRYRKSSEGIRAWGLTVATKYVQRIDIIKAARSIDELAGIRTLDFHQLKGDRANQYALKLTGLYRLIITLADVGIMVEEVSKHYGD